MADIEKMREMGRKGGAAMKQRLKDDPTYFSRIGSLGGKQGVGKKRSKYAMKKTRKKRAAPETAASAPVVISPAPRALAAERVSDPQPPTSAIDVLDAILGGL